MNILHRQANRQAIRFDDACSPIEAALKGPARQEIVAEVSKSQDLRTALLRLRDGMRSHVWTAGAQRIDLEGIIKQYDDQTREEGFHAIHDWDGKADSVNEETIPVDVLDYLIDKRGAARPDRNVPAILLDYYFLYLLALLSLRVWDDGNADEHLDRLNDLLAHLQGPNGSGQKFADNAETLLLIATSHYELQEVGYERLLARVATLNQSHRLTIALTHAASMGCHLRFGFEATYGRDTLAMRADNVADYPWLCSAVTTLMREYSRMHEQDVREAQREAVVEAMLNGLSPDARALIGEPPLSLSRRASERAEFRDLFFAHRQDLLAEFERHRPSAHAYSPLSLYFNFSHNVLKGTVIDALLRGQPWNLTLNDLFTESRRGQPQGEGKEALAKTLMTYARASPDTIRGRLMPAIVYDARSGQRAFDITMQKIK